jgi:putative glycosyltransferase (TIGR04372 family)
MTEISPLTVSISTYAANGDLRSAMQDIGGVEERTDRYNLLYILSKELYRHGRAIEALSVSIALFEEDPTHLDNVTFLVDLLLASDLRKEAFLVLGKLMVVAEEHPVLFKFISHLQQNVLHRIGTHTSSADSHQTINRLHQFLKVVLKGKKLKVDILDYTTIGGLSVDARRLPKLKEAGLIEDVIFLIGKPANEHLAKMLGRTIPLVVDESIKGGTDVVFDWSTQTHQLQEDAFKAKFWGPELKDRFDDCFEFLMSTNGRAFASPEKIAEVDTLSTRIKFTPEEEEQGQHYCRNVLGIPEHASIIGVQVRDSAFYKESLSSPKAFRNADPERFIASIQSIAQLGHYVVRFGAKVTTPLHISHPHFIDYATNHRTEFMDVYLMSKVRFLIAVPTGLGHLAEVFTRPILHVNAVNMYAYNASLYIPKKLRCARTGRLLKFKEAIERIYSYPNFMNLWEDGPGQLQHLGVVYEENTSVEIQEAALEMEARLSGSFVESEESRELQRIFATFWQPYARNFYSTQKPIASSYLLRNRDLF